MCVCVCVCVCERVCVCVCEPACLGHVNNYILTKGQIVMGNSATIESLLSSGKARVISLATGIRV